MTKSKTSVDVHNFEEDLKRELVAQGVMNQADIDAGKLNIEAVEAKKNETQEVLPWQGGTVSGISSITLGDQRKKCCYVWKPK